MTRFLLCLAGLTCAGALSCTQPLPADGTSCPDTVCSSRGVCTYKDTYPSCACADGYTGIVCSRCADGFHRAADDSCVADGVCMPGMCGASGQCQVVNGDAVCACVVGYQGPTCAACKGGYHAVGDGGCELDSFCLPSTCGDGGVCSQDAGRVSCACAADRAGSFCERRTATCASNNPCSANGTCREAGGVVSCACRPGSAGPTCSDCYPGYAASDAGCVQAPSCSASACSMVGACSVDGGTLSCACEAGYEGSACQRCAAGFHRAGDYRCVADETCVGNGRCSANGTCAVRGGVAVCECQSGYAGDTCNTCYPGYHPEDGGSPDGGVGCVLDTTCRPETCRFHGACSADGGVARCACNPGYSGAFCETNVDDCVNSACNGARCVDLIDSNVCLCDGGVFGQVCP
ncbi:MAG: hypothetical protein GQE15_38180 [Archangiaceae bacterium]|nr:hypothetical protein [Archangiaceae bacterium]